MHCKLTLLLFLTRMMYITDLNKIAADAIKNDDKHVRFRIWLKGKDGDRLDELVHDINERVSAAIDCTQCGNCCRSLMVSVNKEDVTRLARHLNMTEETVREKYIEKSGESDEDGEEECIVNTIPCHFLSGNKCSIYEHRFSDCREFPYLHLPGFQQRLLNVLFNQYKMCPIVYNVVEELKERMRFR